MRSLLSSILVSILMLVPYTTQALDVLSEPVSSVEIQNELVTLTFEDSDDVAYAVLFDEIGERLEQGTFSITGNSLSLGTSLFEPSATLVLYKDRPDQRYLTFDELTFDPAAYFFIAFHQNEEGIYQSDEGVIVHAVQEVIGQDEQDDASVFSSDVVSGFTTDRLFETEQGSPEIRNLPLYASSVDRKPNLLETVFEIINYGLGFLGIIAVFLLIYQGVVLILSRGNEEQFKKAKSMLINFVLGFFLIIFSYFIVSNIIRLIQRSDETVYPSADQPTSSTTNSAEDPNSNPAGQGTEEERANREAEVTIPTKETSYRRSVNAVYADIEVPIDIKESDWQATEVGFHVDFNDDPTSLLTNTAVYVQVIEDDGNLPFTIDKSLATKMTPIVRYDDNDNGVGLFVLFPDALKSRVSLGCTKPNYIYTMFEGPTPPFVKRTEPFKTPLVIRKSGEEQQTTCEYVDAASSDTVDDLQSGTLVSGYDRRLVRYSVALAGSSLSPKSFVTGGTAHLNTGYVEQDLTANITIVDPNELSEGVTVFHDLYLSTGEKIKEGLKNGDSFSIKVKLGDSDTIVDTLYAKNASGNTVQLRKNTLTLTNKSDPEKIHAAAGKLVLEAINPFTKEVINLIKDDEFVVTLPPQVTFVNIPLAIGFQSIAEPTMMTVESKDLGINYVYKKGQSDSGVVKDEQRSSSQISFYVPDPQKTIRIEKAGTYDVTVTVKDTLLGKTLVSETFTIRATPDGTNLKLKPADNIEVGQTITFDTYPRFADNSSLKQKVVEILQVNADKTLSPVKEQVLTTGNNTYEYQFTSPGVYLAQLTNSIEGQDVQPVIQKPITVLPKPVKVDFDLIPVIGNPLQYHLVEKTTYAQPKDQLYLDISPEHVNHTRTEWMKDAASGRLFTTITFAEKGDYTLTLIVRNAMGQVFTKEKSLSIASEVASEVVFKNIYEQQFTQDEQLSTPANEKVIFQLVGRNIHHIRVYEAERFLGELSTYETIDNQQVFRSTVSFSEVAKTTLRFDVYQHAGDKEPEATHTVRVRVNDALSPSAYVSIDTQDTTFKKQSRACVVDGSSLSAYMVHKGDVLNVDASASKNSFGQSYPSDVKGVFQWLVDGKVIAENEQQLAFTIPRTSKDSEDCLSLTLKLTEQTASGARTSEFTTYLNAENRVPTLDQFLVNWPYGSVVLPVSVDVTLQGLKDPDSPEATLTTQWFYELDGKTLGVQQGTGKQRTLLVEDNGSASKKHTLRMGATITDSETGETVTYYSDEREVLSPDDRTLSLVLVQPSISGNQSYIPWVSDGRPLQFLVRSIFDNETIVKDSQMYWSLQRTGSVEGCSLPTETSAVVFQRSSKRDATLTLNQCGRYTLMVTTSSESKEAKLELPLYVYDDISALSEAETTIYQQIAGFDPSVVSLASSAQAQVVDTSLVEITLQDESKVLAANKESTLTIQNDKVSGSFEDVYEQLEGAVANSSAILTTIASQNDAVQQTVSSLQEQGKSNDEIVSTLKQSNTNVSVSPSRTSTQNFKDVYTQLHRLGASDETIVAIAAKGSDRVKQASEQLVQEGRSVSEVISLLTEANETVEVSSDPRVTLTIPEAFGLYRVKGVDQSSLMDFFSTQTGKSHSELEQIISGSSGAETVEISMNQPVQMSSVTAVAQMKQLGIPGSVIVSTLEQENASLEGQSLASLSTSDATVTMKPLAALRMTSEDAYQYLAHIGLSDEAILRTLQQGDTDVAALGFTENASVSAVLEQLRSMNQVITVQRAHEFDLSIKEAFQLLSQFGLTPSQQIEMLVKQNTGLKRYISEQLSDQNPEQILTALLESESNREQMITLDISTGVAMTLEEAKQNLQKRGYHIALADQVLASMPQKDGQVTFDLLRGQPVDPTLIAQSMTELGYSTSVIKAFIEGLPRAYETQVYLSPLASVRQPATILHEALVASTGSGVFALELLKQNNTVLQTELRGPQLDQLSHLIDRDKTLQLRPFASRAVSRGVAMSYYEELHYPKAVQEQLLSTSSAMLTTVPTLPERLNVDIGTALAYFTKLGFSTEQSALLIAVHDEAFAAFIQQFSLNKVTNDELAYAYAHQENVGVLSGDVLQTPTISVQDNQYGAEVTMQLGGTYQLSALQAATILEGLGFSQAITQAYLPDLSSLTAATQVTIDLDRPVYVNADDLLDYILSRNQIIAYEASQIAMSNSRFSPRINTLLQSNLTTDQLVRELRNVLQAAEIKATPLQAIVLSDGVITEAEKEVPTMVLLQKIAYDNQLQNSDISFTHNNRVYRRYVAFPSRQQVVEDLTRTYGLLDEVTSDQEQVVLSLPPRVQTTALVASELSPKDQKLASGFVSEFLGGAEPMYTLPYKKVLLKSAGVLSFSVVLDGVTKRIRGYLPGFMQGLFQYQEIALDDSRSFYEQGALLTLPNGTTFELVYPSLVQKAFDYQPLEISTLSQEDVTPELHSSALSNPIVSTYGTLDQIALLDCDQFGVVMSAEDQTSHISCNDLGLLYTDLDVVEQLLRDTFGSSFVDQYFSTDLAVLHTKTTRSEREEALRRLYQSASEHVPTQQLEQVQRLLSYIEIEPMTKAALEVTLTEQVSLLKERLLSLISQTEEQGTTRFAIYLSEITALERSKQGALSRFTDLFEYVVTLVSEHYLEQALEDELIEVLRRNMITLTERLKVTTNDQLEDSEKKTILVNLFETVQNDLKTSGTSLSTLDTAKNKLISAIASLELPDSILASLLQEIDQYVTGAATQLRTLLEEQLAGRAQELATKLSELETNRRTSGAVPRIFSAYQQVYDNILSAETLDREQKNASLLVLQQGLEQVMQRITTTLASSSEVLTSERDGLMQRMNLLDVGQLNNLPITSLAEEVDEFLAAERLVYTDLSKSIRSEVSQVLISTVQAVIATLPEDQVDPLIGSITATTFDGTLLREARVVAEELPRDVLISLEQTTVTQLYGLLTEEAQLFTPTLLDVEGSISEDPLKALQTLEQWQKQMNGEALLLERKVAIGVQLELLLQEIMKQASAKVRSQAVLVFADARKQVNETLSVSLSAPLSVREALQRMRSLKIGLLADKRLPLQTKFEMLYYTQQSFALRDLMQAERACQTVFIIEDSQDLRRACYEMRDQYTRFQPVQEVQIYALMHAAYQAEKDTLRLDEPVLETVLHQELQLLTTDSSLTRMERSDHLTRVLLVLEDPRVSDAERLQVLSHLYRMTVLKDELLDVQEARLSEAGVSLSPAHTDTILRQAMTILAEASAEKRAVIRELLLQYATYAQTNPVRSYQVLSKAYDVVQRTDLDTSVRQRVLSLLGVLGPTNVYVDSSTLIPEASLRLFRTQLTKVDENTRRLILQEVTELLNLLEEGARLDSVGHLEGLSQLVEEQNIEPELKQELLFHLFVMQSFQSYFIQDVPLIIEEPLTTPNYLPEEPESNKGGSFFISLLWFIVWSIVIIVIGAIAVVIALYIAYQRHNRANPDEQIDFEEYILLLRSQFLHRLQGEDRESRAEEVLPELPKRPEQLEQVSPEQPSTPSVAQEGDPSVQDETTEPHVEEAQSEPVAEPQSTGGQVNQEPQWVDISDIEPHDDTIREPQTTSDSPSEVPMQDGPSPSWLDIDTDNDNASPDHKETT